MTDKPTPTDAELKAMWQLHAADIGGIFYYARAVLAKWGTTAPVGVGEVAERYRNAIASACEGWTMPDGLRKHLEAALWSPPTPQPTQAVPPAGREPRYRLLVRGLDKIEASDEFLREDGVTWRADPSGIFVGCLYEGTIFLPARRRMEGGIKGGQHGTE